MSTTDAARSRWHGLTGSEALELQDAARTPTRLAMPTIDRYRDLAAEYAERTVRALVSNDLMGALRSAQIATSAWQSVDYELRHEEFAKQMREQWERQENPPAPTALPARRRR